jgi:hypothetical protein
MPVTVTISRHPSGNSAADITHDDASTIDVSDGHLIVKRRAGQSLHVAAIYAPGKWLDAVVIRND